MTLFVDTSALVRRYAHDRDHALVTDAMDADPDWCASALSRTEAQLVLQLHKPGRAPACQAAVARSVLQ